MLLCYNEGLWLVHETALVRNEMFIITDKLG